MILQNNEEDGAQGLPPGDGLPWGRSGPLVARAGAGADSEGAQGREARRREPGDGTTCPAHQEQGEDADKDGAREGAATHTRSVSYPPGSIPVATGTPRP